MLKKVLYLYNTDQSCCCCCCSVDVVAVVVVVFPRFFTPQCHGRVRITTIQVRPHSTKCCGQATPELNTGGRDTLGLLATALPLHNTQGTNCSVDTIGLLPVKAHKGWSTRPIGGGESRMVMTASGCCCGCCSCGECFRENKNLIHNSK